MSNDFKEAAGALDITLKLATTKHAQKIGILERSHASINKSLTTETGERISFWHKYVTIAVPNYNTSYHASFGSGPSRLLHGRILYNVLDIKLVIRPQQRLIPTSQIAQKVFDQTEVIFQDVRKNAMQAYIKYKAYYDKKANNLTLKIADYAHILQPKLDHQRCRIPFMEFQWIGPYLIEMVLPNNYLVRKVGTNRTQMPHRMRLHQFTPRPPLADVQTSPQDWKFDPEVSTKHNDLYARAWERD